MATEYVILRHRQCPRGCTVRCVADTGGHLSCGGHDEGSSDQELETVREFAPEVIFESRRDPSKAFTERSSAMLTSHWCLYSWV